MTASDTAHAQSAWNCFRTLADAAGNRLPRAEARRLGLSGSQAAAAHWVLWLYQAVQPSQFAWKTFCGAVVRRPINERRYLQQRVTRYAVIDDLLLQSALALSASPRGYRSAPWKVIQRQFQDAATHYPRLLRSAIVHLPANSEGEVASPPPKLMTYLGWNCAEKIVFAIRDSNRCPWFRGWRTWLWVNSLSPLWKSNAPLAAASPGEAAASDPEAAPLLWPDLTSLQRKIIDALAGKGKVRYGAVLKTAYKRSKPRQNEEESFHKFISRMNSALTGREPRVEVKRKGDSIWLADINTGEPWTADGQK